VDYSDGMAAHYTYQKDNAVAQRGTIGIPLLKTCDDVRYGGAMRQIEYAFASPDQIHRKLKSEKKTGSGEAVSTLTFPGDRAQTRLETRGDGPKRTFNYSSKGRLLNHTDFKNSTDIATHLTYDAGRAVHIQTDGANVVVEKSYDENFQLNALIQQDGTAFPPTTTLEYWPVGLLRSVHDPRNPNWTTSYTYTARNQLETVTDALSHRTSFHYDPAGNVDYVDRPDGRRQTRSYDEMNRVLTAIEPVTDTTNKTTAFTYWPSGRVKSVEDNNHQITRFNYDNWDRQQYMFYPDNTFQQWDYNQVGLLQGHRTVGGKIQRFQYDSRNRMTDTWWDPGDPAEWTHYDFNAANRLTHAGNQNGTISRQYDDAGRLLTEEQNVYGLGAKTVSYGSDGAGKRNALGIIGTDYQFAYQYDPLGRLEQILNVQSSATGAVQSLWYQYSYDAASNQTERYCPMNGIAQIYSRDQLGRIDTLTIQKATELQYGAIEPLPIAASGSDPAAPVPALPKPLSILVGLTNLTSAVSDTIPTVGTVVSSEHYLYNDLSQVTAVQRASGQNESFAYDYSGQLTSASYVGWYQGTGTRYASYAQDALGNRSQATDNGVSQGYSPVQSYLNQYASGPAGAVSSDSEHAVVGYETSPTPIVTTASWQT
jgi:YD repeat-containing protein